jgi:uncharacterized membrane protein YkvI
VKPLFNILRTVFLITGTIIGAGFITGAELISFFGANNFLTPVIMATFFIGLVLAVIFCSLKNAENSTDGVGKLTHGKFYRTATCFSSLVFSASTLAGIDALLNTVVNLGGFQVGSIVVITLVSVFSKHGVKGMEKLNFFLMPIIIIALNLLIFSKQSINLSNLEKTTVKGGAKSLLYVFINVFISIPVMSETLQNKSKKALVTISFVVGIIIGLQALIILVAVKNSGINAYTDMPLYYALYNGEFSAIYFTSMLTCALTSAFTTYYPLYQYSKKKANGFGLGVCALLTLIFSKLGLEKIVSYAYPIVGSFGVLFLLKSLGSIKRKTYADNNSNYLNQGGIMSRKKKNKVIKLTDEEYGAYIMALKDERPPKIVRETQEN